MKLLLREEFLAIKHEVVFTSINGGNDDLETLYIKAGNVGPNDYCYDSLNGTALQHGHEVQATYDEQMMKLIGRQSVPMSFSCATRAALESDDLRHYVVLEREDVAKLRDRLNEVLASMDGVVDNGA